MEKEVIYTGIRKPQCNICEKKTNISLIQVITSMDKDFKTKQTKATFFCNEHKGNFNIIGKDKFYYGELEKV